MFELVERNPQASARKATTVIVSIIAHLVVIGLIVVIPLLYYTDNLPTPKDVMTAFVASPPPPAPPPPPPPPPAAAAAEAPKPVPTTGQTAPLAPVAPPDTISNDVASTAPGETGGVEGGVPGGIAGGVQGGTLGGLPSAPPSAVRVGGKIAAPALQHRVDPAYPPLARASHTQGVVILEATVDISGQVQNVRVLRGNPMLNDAAINAVKQWRYSPLMLNGTATPFILTVTVNFTLGG